MGLTYLVIAILLLVGELVYFRIAAHFNIIDKPNERSSHSTIVLRGGGIIFTLSMLVWAGLQLALGNGALVMSYLPFLIGLVLIAGISFVDDIVSLPDGVRLVAQFIAMGLMFWNLGIMHWDMWWIVLITLIVFVGATNVINFMDGINGITAGYSLAVLVPLALLNGMPDLVGHDGTVAEQGVIAGQDALITGSDVIAGSTGNLFIDQSYLIVAILGVLVFSFFNFRPRGKAKCFAGDVGSVGIAFIMLFAIGRLILQTGDITWLAFLLVYGVDGCCTILHRIMLHEHLGEAHRKHAYQLMANELGMSHVVVSLIYMGLQLAISLGMVYIIPNTPLAHWIYLVAVGIALALAYLLFMKKYYHLHEEYLESLKK